MFLHLLSLCLILITLSEFLALESDRLNFCLKVKDIKSSHHVGIRQAKCDGDNDEKVYTTKNIRISKSRFSQHNCLDELPLLPNGADRIFPKQQILMSEKVKSFRECFVETGTNLGATTYLASGYYRDVNTVEFYGPLYNKALVRFSEANASNIKVHLGDTIDVLPQIVQQHPNYGGCVFLLDAHNTFAAKKWARSDNPILREIDYIMHSRHSEHAYIVVDDYRLFGAETLGGRKVISPYPTPTEIQQRVCATWPNATFLVGEDTLHIVPMQ